MPIVTSRAFGGPDRAFDLLQQIETHRPSAQLGARRAEAPRDPETERLRIERDSALEVGDVDIDEQIRRHRLIRANPAWGAAAGPTFVPSAPQRVPSRRRAARRYLRGAPKPREEESAASPQAEP